MDDNIKNSIKLQKAFHDEIAGLEEKVKREEEKYTAGQKKIEDLEKEHRNFERSLKTLEDQKKKIEDKLFSIKTNKEYQASLKEIEGVKETIKQKEDVTIESLDNIELSKKSLNDLEKQLSKSKENFQKKKTEIEEKLKKHLADVEKQKEKRDGIIKEIDAEIFADYKRIQNVKDGFAVAIAKNEQCMGCSMMIPPQIYNEVVCSEKIKTCPYCHRILYVQYESAKNEA